MNVSLNLRKSSKNLTKNKKKNHFEVVNGDTGVPPVVSIIVCVPPQAIAAGGHTRSDSNKGLQDTSFGRYVLAVARRQSGFATARTDVLNTGETPVPPVLTITYQLP